MIASAYLGPYHPATTPAARIGRWTADGAAVAIAPHWWLTAKHVNGGDETGGGGADTLTTNNPSATLTITDIINHPTLDLQLIRVEEEQTVYHPVEAIVDALAGSEGTAVIMAGFGLTTNDAYPGPFDADVPEGTERWVTNTIAVFTSEVGDYTALRTTFSDLGVSSTEGQACDHDSGGGVFRAGPNGQLLCIGIIVSASDISGTIGYGPDPYDVNTSVWSAAVAIDTAIRDWINETIAATDGTSDPTPAEEVAYPPPGAKALGIGATPNWPY